MQTKNDFLFFGSESYGLPMELMQLNWENAITIPMKSYGRSLISHKRWYNLL